MLHDYRLVQYDMTKGKNYLSNYGDNARDFAQIG